MLASTQSGFSTPTLELVGPLHPKAGPELYLTLCIVTDEWGTHERQDGKPDTKPASVGTQPEALNGGAA